MSAETFRSILLDTAIFRLESFIEFHYKVFLLIRQKTLFDKVLAA